MGVSMIPHFVSGGGDVACNLRKSANMHTALEKSRRHALLLQNTEQVWCRWTWSIVERQSDLATVARSTPDRRPKYLGRASARRPGDARDRNASYY